MAAVDLIVTDLDGSFWFGHEETRFRALEFLERKDRMRFVNVSRLFIYYNERVIEHTTKSDSGAMIRAPLTPARTEQPGHQCRRDHADAHGPIGDQQLDGRCRGPDTARSPGRARGR